jgi:TRAP-type C4-dicarboxylate transport system substrate-binding protein
MEFLEAAKAASAAIGRMAPGRHRSIMRMAGRFFAIGAVVATAALGATAARAEKWDMPLAYPASNFHSETAAKFAASVKEKTGGKIEITTHPGGSLFKGDEIFRAVRTGQAQIGERLISALGNEGPIFEIDAVPFLATSYEQAKKLYDASKAATEKALEAKGLKLLYTVVWPPQGLYAQKEINSAADMKGVKFRAYNPATSKIAELLGAVPTKIEAAEVPQAFATGVVESMITSASTGYDSKIWESCKFYYDAQAWLPKNMVIVNLGVWKGLDAATQKAIMEAAAEAETQGWAKSQELSGFYKAELEKNGMKVLPLGAQLKADFAKIGETMTAEWLAKAGDDGKAAVEAFRK